MACSMRIFILLWAILRIYVGHIFYTATHFGFGIISFFTGRKKRCHFMSLLIGLHGHCKFRLDTRTKKKTKDGPLALPVHTPLDKVSVFPVSIPLEDLPLYTKYPFLHLMTLNFRYQFLWR